MEHMEHGFFVSHEVTGACCAVYQLLEQKIHCFILWQNQQSTTKTATINDRISHIHDHSNK